MRPVSQISQAAVDAGCGGRFRYWAGRSGIRHLFTSVDTGTLADFPDGVALIAEGGKVIWAGEAEHAPDVAEGQEAFVHLLARSRKTRQLVADDLSPLHPAWRSLFGAAGPRRQVPARRAASRLRFASGIPSSDRCSAVFTT